MDFKIVTIIFTVVVTIGFVIALRESIKAHKEIKRLERIANNYATGAIKVEENIKRANDEKKKLNTGNTTIDVNNATDIMSNIANKRSQS